MPLKVLMFGWELPPHNSGGLGVACSGLTQALAQQNVDITFVLPQQMEVYAPHMKVVFADLNFPWPDFSPYLTNLPDSPHGLPKNLLEAVRLYAARARDISKSCPHHLVHAHDWLCFPAGIVGSNTSGKPLVTHIHATEFDRSGGQGANPLVYAIEKQGFSKSKAVIAISNYVKNILLQQYQSDPSRIHVVHNGINYDEYSGVADSDPLQALHDAGFKVVLYVGRLTLQKGVDYFIQAAQKVLQFQPQTAFIIVGSGDMEGQLVELTSRLRISDKVLFAGFLRGQILKSTFKSADLFVMPSVSEPFGLTALESVASGTPAIISKQSGVSETLNHVLKVDFWDVDEMTNQVVSSLRHPSLRHTLRDNGRREVKKVSWDKAAAKTIDVYKQVLNN